MSFFNPGRMTTLPSLREVLRESKEVWIVWIPIQEWWIAEQGEYFST